MAKSLFPYINVTYEQKNNILVSLGLIYYILDEPDQAILEYKDLPDLVSQNQGDESMEMARIWNDLGRFYLIKGETKQAMQLFEAALQLSVKINGKYYSSNACYINNIANAY